MRLLRQMRRRARGATLTEYALVLALIALVAIVVLTVLGGKVHDTFDRINTCFSGTC